MIQRKARAFVLITLLLTTIFTGIGAASSLIPDQTESTSYLPTIIGYSEPLPYAYQCSISPSKHTVDDRISHAAVLLDSGKVLLTGGYQYDGNTGIIKTVDSAEVFDPQTGGFLYGGQMTNPRSLHSTTKLQDGRVLIAGGMNAYNLFNGEVEFEMLGTAEVYDPKTGIFTATGPMNYRRDAHTAVLLNDGRVLLAGGRSLYDDGGCCEPSQTAELYDPTSGTFSITSPMTAKKIGDQAASVLLNDGRAFVTSGSGIYGVTNVYDPQTDSFFETADMIIDRSSPVISLLGSGDVIIIGKGAEVFNPQTNRFTLVANTNEFAISLDRRKQSSTEMY